MLRLRRRDRSAARERRDLLEMTCVVDGHAHLVAVDAFGTAATSSRWAIPALCGHEVTACSMSSPPGPPCRSCDDALTHAAERL